jgi:type IV secretory pathway TrbD component
MSVIILAPLLGAVLGGLMGYVRASKNDPAMSFRWRDVVETMFTGVIAGGLWLGAIDWSNAQFGPAVVIAGLFIGAGVDYGAKKTVLP